jgi:extradiol dioxygenase
MRVHGLGYVGVESPDFKEFEVLGPEVFAMGIAEPGSDGTCYLRLDDRHHRIAVHPGTRNRLSYLGWELATPDEHGSALEELASAGVVTTPATDEELEDRQVAGMSHFATPCGFRYEFFYGAEEKDRSFVPGRPVSGFVTGTLGMGHVVVSTPDHRREREFLMRVLGFRLTDIVVVPGDDLYFLRTTPRHHSIACLPTPGLRGLQHILVQVHELEDVGIALGKVMERGLHVTASLGKHATDQMVSFYVRTPGGFDIEYGWNGLLVNEETWTVRRSTQPVAGWRHQNHPAPPELEAQACTEALT